MTEARLVSPEQLRAASHPHAVMLNLFVLPRRCSTQFAPRAPIGDMGYGS
jgi:hypothetical protein